ncbi:3-oxoacyl-[acyl-carrier-protein] reductase FabG-like [Leguminivora glycinivorella]|uniref:3-oxoacyl-[acyl-carrier-protein] reductase FabG-like n=1 Tax=Leguminivora glycinivorella TaxID=1035111 RepID=UPI00201073FC|nr:3-oxoacyl-[acyl-carrier-protein] reductase FabG-like [Leguminivora glycinivorella]
MSFTDKVAIVTGASSGIGAATAVALAKDGAKVVLVARNEAKLSQVAQQCEQHDAKYLIIKADVSKDEEVKTIVEKTINKFGQIDVLVNNAGFGKNASILAENIMENFDHIMNTNLRAVVYLTHLAAPHLIKTKGNIVNISSVISLRIPSGDCLSYAVSKAGLDHFTRCVALDLSPHGVRVNCVNPGPVKTDVLANAGVQNPDMLFEYWKSKTLLKRMGEPEEIADLILFLASDKARSITGSTFVSDNGARLA